MSMTEFPSKISQLPNIKKLDLSVNQLSKIDDQIMVMKNLEVLILSNNSFKSGTSFDDSIRLLTKLNKLSILDLSYNSLSDLPDSFASIYLTNLLLNNNLFMSYPPILQSMGLLQELNLSENQIDEIDSEFPVKLKILDLGNNKLKEVPLGIFKLKELIILNLEKNKIDILPDNIGELQFLQVLNINNNNLSALPKTLSLNNNLVSLNISKNKITNASLFNIPSSLEVCILSYNNLTFDRFLDKFITGLFAYSPKLRLFDMENNIKLEQFYRLTPIKIAFINRLIDVRPIPVGPVLYKVEQERDKLELKSNLGTRDPRPSYVGTGREVDEFERDQLKRTEERTTELLYNI